MNPTNRRWAFVALLALANAGCGMGFFYNNLDRLVRWELREVLTMTPDQEAFFEAEFAALWHWHRTEELPRYADDLDLWAKRFGGTATQADIHELFATLEGWWLRLEAKGTPFVAQFLGRLDDQQVASLAEALEESNADWESSEKGKPIDAVRKGWRKDFEDILKRLIGRLTSDQRALLAEAAERYQPERQLWADYRRRWQSDLFALLEQRREVDDFGERFAQLVKSQKTYYGEQFAKVEAANEALVKSALVAVLNQSLPRQRQRLGDTLADRAQALRALVAGGTAH